MLLLEREYLESIDKLGRRVAGDGEDGETPIWNPTYPIEQNRIKNQSNPIKLQSLDWVRQSNKIEHLFCCEFDFRTNQTNIIEQNRTKSN